MARYLFADEDDKGIIWLIFFVALFVRLLNLFWVPASIGGDAVDYQRLAASILNGQGFSYHGVPTSLRPPLYPFFLASIYYLFGNSLNTVIWVQSLISAINCLLIYHLAKNVFDQKTALLAGVLAVFHFSFVFDVKNVMSETLFTFFLLLLVIWTYRSYVRGAYIDFFICGALNGIAALLKPMVIFYPLFAFPFIYFGQRRKLKILVYAAPYVIAYLLVITPWTIRNYMVQKGFVPIATEGGIAFYSSYKPPNGVFGLCSRDETVKYAQNNFKNEKDRSDYLFSEGVRYIRENLGKMPALEVKKLFSLFLPFDWEIMGRPGIWNFSYAFIFPFFLLGTFFSLRDEKARILLLPIVYIIFIALLFYGSARFRMPFESMLVILGAYGLSELVKKYKQRIVLSCVGVYFALNFGLFLLGPSLKMFIKELIK